MGTAKTATCSLEQILEATSQKNSSSMATYPPSQVRQTRHAEPCWKKKNELMNNVLLWTLIYIRAKNVD